jgi:3-hydroxyisobutyrate dehydrogenase-like beta-hydroxyacid dehydrogenase
MSEVSVIGLGLMGSALARALVENGCAVTVWNRSPEKAVPLLEKGARLAPDAGAAAAASPVIMICVTNYSVANLLLNENAARFSGKLLVQLSTGTPNDARLAEAWARHNQVEYLEGKITGSPSSIGKPNAQILISGPQDVFQKAEPLLRVLAGKIDYKGAEIGMASAWDLMMIMPYYGMFLSLLHSVQICQAEGIPLEEFSNLLGEQGKGYEKWLCDNIRIGSYSETSAPLELWDNGISLIVQQAQESKINAEFPMFTSALFKRAMHAGYAKEEVSALYKVLSR